jgi:hypothetical protein
VTPLAVHRPKLRGKPQCSARPGASIAEGGGRGRQSDTATAVVRGPNLGLAATVGGTATSAGVGAADAVALKRTVAR